MGVDLSIWMVKYILSHYHDYSTILNPRSDIVVEKEQKGSQHLYDVHLEVRSLPAYLSSEWVYVSVHHADVAVVFTRNH